MLPAETKKTKKNNFYQHLFNIKMEIKYELLKIAFINFSRQIYQAIQNCKKFIDYKLFEF